MASNDPVIQNVIYDGTQVAVQWRPSDDTGVTGYIIQLSYIGQAAGGVAYASALIPDQQSSFGRLTLGAALNTDVVYLVTVLAMWDSTPGEASAPVAMPTALPVLVHAWYDSEVIRFAWTPGAASAQGYQLLVYSLDSGVQYSCTIADTAARSGTIPASVLTSPLDPAQQWVASVAALGENNTFARTPAALFPKPLPELAPSIALYRGGKDILAQWTPLSSASVTGIRMALTSPQDATDVWIDLPSPGAANGILPLPSALPGRQSFEFHLIALTSSGAGVASPPLGVVNTVPPLASITYDGKDKVSMTWLPETSPATTGFTLQVISLASGFAYDSDISDPFATKGNVTVASLDAAQSWVARLIANGEVGAQSVDYPLPAVIPKLTGVRCDGSTVAVEWGVLAPDPGLVVAGLLSDGTLISRTEVSGTAASLTVPANAAKLTVQVAPRIGIATGAHSTAAKVIASAPQVTTLHTDPVTGAAKLSWTSIADASEYRLQFSDGTRATVAATDYDFPAPLAANAVLSVTVTAAAVDTDTTSTGPTGAATVLATRQPVLLRAGFDGINACADWTAVAEAVGYRVSVQQAGSSALEVAYQDVPAGVESTILAFIPPDPAQTYVLGVQAKFGNTPTASSGPLSATKPLFHAGFYLSSAVAATAYPYAYPATRLATAWATAPGEAIKLYLPPIGGTPPLTDLPISKAPFTLDHNSDSFTQAIYPYVLSFAADSAVWTFTSEPVRRTLRNQYIDFLKACEQPSGVVPWGIALLQQVISRYMPQTFQEMLYYAYGLSFPGYDAGDNSNGTAYADLRPGMVLRVAADPYQAITESSTLKWASGYVAAPVVDYDIGSFIDSAGNWSAGYDNFIGQLVAANALSVKPPEYHQQTLQQAGVADAADLYFPGFRKPFYRLFVPTELADPSKPCPTDTPRSFVLAAAPTYSALTTTTNTPGGSYPVAYFRGRAVVRPCLRVSLNGNECVVPVGTTVGNLLERAGRGALPATAPLHGLEVRRALGPVVLDPGQPVVAGASYRLQLDWKTQPQYGSGWNALSIPLLPGDSIRM